MKQPAEFLRAEWKNLLMLNYVVPPLLLEPLVPFGTRLDAFEERTYVSLVGFEFNRTRIGGISVPFHRSFEEVNLRFYVKRGCKRGVVFIRELVPKFAVAAIARYRFNENYSCISMSHRIEIGTDGVVRAEYSWGSGRNRCAMRVQTSDADILPADSSLSQFITEHYWGYAVQKGGGCLEYEVKHPRWRVREARVAEFSGDVTRFYGPGFNRVLESPPDSTFLADGSEVVVYRGTRIN